MGVLPGECLEYIPEFRSVVFVGARLDGMYPCFPVCILYVTCNLVVETAQGRVGRVGRAEVVTLSYQSKGIV